MVTQKEIKEALSEIIDPELGTDIVSLGFVKGRETTREKAQKIVKKFGLLAKVRKELEARKDSLKIEKKGGGNQ